MTKQYITLVGPEDLIKQIETSGGSKDLELGRSRPGDALTDAVDTTLGPEEIKLILQVLTVAFSTATAALTFFQRLKDLLARADTKKPVVIQIKDGRTGRKLATIDKETNVDDLIKRIAK